VKAAIARAVERSEAKWAEAGLSVSHKETGMTQFPDAERGIWYSANRTALVEGWMSESMDGKQVSTLMGDYRDPDVGTVRCSIDGVTISPIGDLEQIHVNEVREIRFLSASEATQRFGITSGGSPVIVVSRM
jgi:hypothetical protein